MRTDDDACWPALPYDAWKDTYDTLHLWPQVVGKITLAKRGSACTFRSRFWSRLVCADVGAQPCNQLMASSRWS